jgi:hypothetical protein
MAPSLGINGVQAAALLPEFLCRELALEAAQRIALGLRVYYGFRDSQAELYAHGGSAAVDWSAASEEMMTTKPSSAGRRCDAPHLKESPDTAPGPKVREETPDRTIVGR